jgi:hypothetical protein
MIDLSFLPPIVLAQIHVCAHNRHDRNDSLTESVAEIEHHTHDLLVQSCGSHIAADHYITQVKKHVDSIIPY